MKSRTVLFVLMALAVVFYSSILFAADKKITAVSEKGLYKVSFVCDDAGIKINHSCKLTVHSINGKPVTDAKIELMAMMPEHGKHLAPRRPKVTVHLGDGVYQVDDVKFQMPGMWQIMVNMVIGDKKDKAILGITVHDDGSKEHHDLSQHEMKHE